MGRFLVHATSTKQNMRLVSGVPSRFRDCRSALTTLAARVVRVMMSLDHGRCALPCPWPCIHTYFEYKLSISNSCITAVGQYTGVESYA